MIEVEPQESVGGQILHLILENLVSSDDVCSCFSGSAWFSVFVFVFNI